MTTPNKLNSVATHSAGKAREDATNLEKTAQFNRGANGQDPNKGTGNVANAAMKANEHKGYFGNYDPKASYRRDR